MYNPRKPYKHDILRLIARTWKTPYVEITPGLYTYFERKFTGPEVQHTDGIGTKGIFHWQKRTFEAAVQDALAMNLNDLAMVGARPYALQNHIVLPKDDNDAIVRIVRALVRECRKRGIALTGGETSIHDTTNALDLSITVSGFCKEPRQNQFQAGDTLVGLRSSGLHSNGMTKAREVFRNKYRKEFVVPTKIYSDDILKFLQKHKVSGMMYITGGAFSKLKDILGPHDAHIHHPRKLFPQKIFFDMYKRGMKSKEMYTTFNCGVGFVLSVPKEEVRAALRLPGAAVVGTVKVGSGTIIIESAFDQKLIKL